MSEFRAHSLPWLWTAVLVLSATGWVLWNAGRFLVVNQTPKKSDAIIVLGGGPVNRVEKASELYDQGFAPLLVASGGTMYSKIYTQAEELAMQAEQRGVPASHIVLEQTSQSTEQNAQDTLAVLVHRHLHSAIVVSSDYHMRRVQWLFNHAYRGHPIRLIYVASNDPWFRPTRWWSNFQSVGLTASEYLKLFIAVTLRQ